MHLGARDMDGAGTRVVVRLRAEAAPYGEVTPRLCCVRQATIDQQSTVLRVRARPNRT
jgi:hypothetical protein